MSRFFCSTRGRLATLREALLERVRVVWAAEEILHGVRSGNVAARSEHEIAVAMRGVDVHEAVGEPGPDVGRDRVAPKVSSVCGGVRLAAHVLPVRGPVRHVE